MSLQHTLKALADPIRRDILNMLKGGAMAAGEISEKFSVSGAAISKHLTVLKEAPYGAERSRADPGCPGGQVYFL